MKEIKVALLDFDGTLVTKDILDLLCVAVGKEAESIKLNEAFHRGELPGVTGLIARINFLAGMNKKQISEILRPNDYLMPGARELIRFLKDHKVITILASGNIVPVLEYYQQLLGIDYVVGSKPKMDGETILSIDESAYTSKSYKLDGINAILGNLAVSKENIVAMGDSPSDKGMFELSSYAIAVNPKGNIAEFADAVVNDNLEEAVRLLEKLMID